MGAPKLITVPPNGQVSIGKKWAGRQIVIEEIAESEIRILSGNFIPDSQATFYTAESRKKLDSFNDWEDQHPPKKTDLKKLRERLGRKQKG